jgi:putative addiction module component (TIGR02574 family)
MSTDALLQQAQMLPVAERIRLVEKVWDSIEAEPDEWPLTNEQREELDRRLEDYYANPHVGSPWSEVKYRLLRKP